jgi:hypothetical protein
MSGNTIRTPGPMLDLALRSNNTLRRDFYAAQGHLYPPGKDEFVPGSKGTCLYKPQGSVDCPFYSRKDENFIGINEKGLVSYMTPIKQTNLVGDNGNDQVTVFFGGTMQDVRSGKSVPLDYTIRINDRSSGKLHLYQRPQGQYYERHSIINPDKK